jgi:hypothetical protein
MLYTYVTVTLRFVLAVIVSLSWSYVETSYMTQCLVRLRTSILVFIVMISIITVVHVRGVRVCLWTVATKRPVVHPHVINEYGQQWWNDIDGKTCPSTTLSTTNPTWTNLGANLGLSGERPAINHLSHGTVISVITKHVICVTIQGSHQGVQRKLYSLFLVQVGHYASLSTTWILQNWSSGYCGSIRVLTQSFCLVSELPVFSLKLHKERWTNFILCTWVCLLPPTEHCEHYAIRGCLTILFWMTHYHWYKHCNWAKFWVWCNTGFPQQTHIKGPAKIIYHFNTFPTVTLYS